MEPQVTDYYNEMPQMIHIIDAMNQELAEVQKKYEELQQKYSELDEKHTELDEKHKHNIRVFKEFSTALRNIH